MTIKHLIIARFMCNNFGHANEELFDQKWLKDSFEMLKKHLIKSLLVQTNKNFELVILIHDEIPIENVLFLYDYAQNFTEFNITVLRKNEIENYTKSFYESYDFIITSRIDYDDHIHKNVVEETQKKIDPNYTLILYGLKNGVSLVDGDTECHFMSMNYNECGFFSAFETLMINTKKYDRGITIYSLGDHSLACKYLIKNYENHGIKDKNEVKILCDDIDETRYIWIRHKNSQLVMQKNKWHNTDIIVENLQLEDFGYSI